MLEVSFHIKCLKHCAIVFAFYENHLELSRCKKMHTLLCEEVDTNNNRILPLPNPRHMNKLYLPAGKYVIPLWDSLNTFIRACSIDNIQKQFQLTIIRKTVFSCKLGCEDAFLPPPSLPQRTITITHVHLHDVHLRFAHCFSHLTFIAVSFAIWTTDWVSEIYTTSARFQGKPSSSNRRMSIYLFLVALD